MKKTLAAALFSALTFTGTPSLGHEIGDRMPYLDQIEIVDPFDWIVGDGGRKIGISVLNEPIINGNYRPLIVFYALCYEKILDKPYMMIDIDYRVGYIDTDFNGYIDKVFRFGSLWEDFIVDFPNCPLKI